MAQKFVDSPAAAVEALGGIPIVMKMTGAKNYKAVHNWTRQKTLPSRFYVLMTRELERLGYRARPALWGQVEEVKRRAA